MTSPTPNDLNSSRHRSHYPAAPPAPVLILGWIIPTVVMLIGLLLLLRGDVVIGALLLLLATLRLVLRLSLRYHRWPHRHLGPARLLLRSMLPTARIAAAHALSLTPDSLSTNFQQGRSIAELAAATHVPLDQVTTAITHAVSTQIDAALTSGTTTPAVAAQAKTWLPVWTNRVATAHRRPHHP